MMLMIFVVVMHCKYNVILVSCFMSGSNWSCHRGKRTWGSSSCRCLRGKHAAVG